MGFLGRYRKPKAKLSLKTEKREFVLGEEVKGSVEIKSEEELDIEYFGVALYCAETLKKTRWVSEKDDKGNTENYQAEFEDERELWHSDPLEIFKERHIPQGFFSVYPISFKLPSYGRETYHSVDSNLKWGLSALLKVKGRPLITSVGECEIIVAKPSATHEEVIREVFLIPCAYCGGLMPQTSLFCPNCGARRKT